MINLLMNSHDFMKNNKFADKRRKGEILQKKKIRWFAISTCPPGQVLAGPDMSKFRLLVKFCIFRVQNLFFEVISRSFCMVLRGEAQKTLFLDKKI